MHKRKFLPGTAALVTLAVLVAPSALAGRGGNKPKPPPTPAEPAIAFTGSPSGSLQVMDADGSNPTVIYEADTMYPTWSPDGEHIAFNKDSFSIWRIDVQVVDGVPRGVNPAPLVRGAGEVQGGVQARYPAWSPLGDEVLFAVWGESAPDTLQVVPADGGTPRTIYTAPAGKTLLTPTWSPEGSRIAFAEGSILGGGRLKVLDLDSGTVTTVVDTKGPNRLDWARTRDVVAFGVWHEEPDPQRPRFYIKWWTLHLVDLESGEVTDLGYGGSPTWAPDDTELVFRYSAPDVPKKLQNMIMRHDLLVGEVESLGVRGNHMDWRR